MLAGGARILAGILFYGTHLSLEAAGGALIGLVLGAFAWAAAATAFTSVIRAAEAAGPTFMLTYFPVIIVSGILGSISDLPHWLTTLASCLPAQPVPDVVTRSLQHAPRIPRLPAHDIIVLAARAVAGLIAAVILFRWEPRRPVQRHAARTQEIEFHATSPGDPASKLA